MKKSAFDSAVKQALNLRLWQAGAGRTNSSGLVAGGEYPTDRDAAACAHEVHEGHIWISGQQVKQEFSEGGNSCESE